MESAASTRRMRIASTFPPTKPATAPTASWGTIIEDGAERDAELWWLTLFPGLAILVTVFACNALGDALRDAFDPRQLPRDGSEATFASEA